MFEHFTKTKAEDYLAKVDFIYGRTSLNSLLTHNLPAYIQSYLENNLQYNHQAIEKEQLQEALEKAISLNISYVIKPKATLLRFLFGKVETKPSEEILDKLKYFQFYRYYIDLLEEFITLNNPLRISSNQVVTLINEINKKIYEEITDSDKANAERQRLNLIKLIYYFFMDYIPGNTPINKRLPKAVLSAYFYDKGFLSIKKNTDNFFKDDIFIQEAIRLMEPKEQVEKINIEYEEDRQVSDFIMKARQSRLTTELTQKEIEQTIEQGEKIVELKDIKEAPVPAIEETAEEDINARKDAKPPADIIPDIPVIDIDDRKEEAIYSPALMDEARKITEDNKLSPEEKNRKLINGLFHNRAHRLRIIKKLFRKNESQFREKTSRILSAKDWGEASYMIDDHFEENKIDFLSADAIRFVDIIQSYFLEVKAPTELKDDDEEE